MDDFCLDPAESAWNPECIRVHLSDCLMFEPRDLGCYETMSKADVRRPSPLN